MAFVIFEIHFIKTAILQTRFNPVEICEKKRNFDRINKLKLFITFDAFESILIRVLIRSFSLSIMQFINLIVYNEHIMHILFSV